MYFIQKYDEKLEQNIHTQTPHEQHMNNTAIQQPNDYFFLYCIFGLIKKKGLVIGSFLRQSIRHSF